MINPDRRIAFFLPSLLGGGAERVMVALANGFVDKGMEVDLVLAQAVGPYLSEVSSKVRIIDLKSKRVLFSLWPLVKYLRKERPGFLLSTLEHANVVALWAKFLAGGQGRCVIRMPNMISGSAGYSESFRERLSSLCLKWFSSWADAIVAVSRATAQDLIKSLNARPSKVRVIYNPVINDELFEKAGASLDHPWFVQGALPVILGVGRLSEQKDFPTLVRAFALLRRKRPSRLMILGEGEDRKALEALAAQLGIQHDVLLPGFAENPFPYLKRSSVFVLSSRWEGLPNALIQALALGTPVVATDCPGGVAEIMAEFKAGMLVPVGNEQKLADAMMKLVDEKERPINREMAAFKQETIIEQYLSLISSLK